MRETSNIVDLLSSAKLIRSKSEGRRLIDQGGVRLNGEQLSTVEAEVTHQPGTEQVVQVGKRRFLRVLSI